MELYAIAGGQDIGAGTQVSHKDGTIEPRVFIETGMDRKLAQNRFCRKRKRAAQVFERRKRSSVIVGST